GGRLCKADIGIQREGRRAYRASSCRHDDDAIRAADTIYSGRGGVFEDRHAGDIVYVEVVELVKGILFGLLDAVDDYKRCLATVGRDAADIDCRVVAARFAAGLDA